MVSSSADSSGSLGRGAGAIPGEEPEQLLRSLAERHWALAGEVTLLPGYQDLNGLLLTTRGERFIVKLMAEEEGRPHLEAQHRVLHRLAQAHGTPHVPLPVPTPSGEELVETELHGTDGSLRLARVLRYVPGIPLVRVRPHRASQLTAVGRILARVDLALQDHDEPAAHRDSEWNLIQGRETVEAHLASVQPAERRLLLEQVLSLYDREVRPREAELRRGLIHGDGNDHNLLVAPVGEDLLALREVTGLIDFGDLAHSWVCAEAAIAAAYAMLGKADSLAAAAQVVRGYHSVHPLLEPEVDSLPALISLRLAVTVTLSAVKREEGSNDEYHFVSEAPGWEVLERIVGVHPHYFRAMLREACQLEPFPTSTAVVSWLHENADRLGPVLDPDPSSVPVTKLDFSVGSTQMARVREPSSPEAWSRVVFSLMEELGAQVGVGGYDEARAWYVDPLYADEGENGPVWRTIHLGVDLFVPAGTPVLAPLEGRVHSARDNGMNLDYGPAIVLQHDVGGGELTFYTLYGHLSRDSLEGLDPGTPVQCGQRIGRIGQHDENGGWAPHLHFQIVVDMLGREGEFPGVARPDRIGVWTSVSPDPTPLVPVPGGCRARPRPTVDALREERSRHQGSNLSLSYRKPLAIVRGRGAYLYDVEGRGYLDCVNNVAHVGHSHPRVVEALHGQAATLNTSTRYLHALRLEYTERLADLFPDPLRICFLVNSGSEANELALRLARAHTGRRGVIVQDGAYHGNTTGALQISPYKFDGPGGEGRPDHVRVVPMPDPFRGVHTGTDSGKRYAEEVVRACGDASQEGHPVGAFFAESILSCGGQIIPPEGYLREAFRAVRHAGGVCVADEVQIGFGRVGTHWWGFESQDAVPDVVTLGKPMGNGHPLGAVVTTPQIARSFDTGAEYFSSFGGNAVSCAVGLAVLDVLESEGLREGARRTGTHLLHGLDELKERFELIGDVRGRGLFLGIELVLDRERKTPAPRHASYVVERARELGVLLSSDGRDQNVIKVKPPLVFGQAEADRLVATLERILAEDPVRIF